MNRRYKETRRVYCEQGRKINFPIASGTRKTIHFGCAAGAGGAAGKSKLQTPPGVLRRIGWAVGALPSPVLQ